SASLESDKYAELTGGGLVRGQDRARPLDLAQDLLALRFPSVGPGFEVSLGQIAHDVSDQLAHAGEAAIADDNLRQLAEETLDQIEPGRTGGREMQVEARVLREPVRDAFLRVAA